jgi:hypothetical protein
MKKIVYTLACLVTWLAIATQTIAQAPEVYLMNAARLVQLKKNIQQKDQGILSLVEQLKQNADKLLDKKPLSVMDKGFTPASGSKHDYMSQAPYFWYDSTKPNGLPYMRRDGVRNPEINKITDHGYLSDLNDATYTLSLAWYLTGEEKYAQKAAALIRYWFFEEATKMNPNLDYAQAIPGINNGRGIGIIETRALTGIADAAGLLKTSKSWSAADHKSLQKWYADYLDWLLTSKNGNEEHKAKNNHGTWFHAQAIDYALFTGNKAKARELVLETKAMMDTQITKEGKLPLELERTTSMHYTMFNLYAWFNIATLAKQIDMDVWNQHNNAGAGIHTAVDWFLPYALDGKKWEYQQINKYNNSELYTFLMQAGAAWKNPAYIAQAEQLKPGINDPVALLLNNK